jgi:OB-fold nucleic acid binding domain
VLASLPPTIKQILTACSNKSHREQDHAVTTVYGWIKSIRRQKGVSFAVVNDGTTLKGLQAVFLQPEAEQAALMKRLTTGASVCLSGKLIESLGRGQDYELRVQTVEVMGDSDPEVISTPCPHVFHCNSFAHILEISYSKKGPHCGILKGELSSPCAHVPYCSYATRSRQNSACIWRLVQGEVRSSTSISISSLLLGR